MSNLGQLNERLKQKISERQKETETLIQQELEQLTVNLKAEYQSALNTIVSDIHDQSQRLQTELNTQKRQAEKLIREIRKASVMSWIKPSLIAILILISIFGGSWGLMQYLSTRIQDQLEQIDQNQKILDQLPTGARLIETEDGKYLVFTAEPEHYTTKSGSLVIKLQKN